MRGVTWNRFPIKICWWIWLRPSLVETNYLTQICELSHSHESRDQSFVSSKACSTPRAFNCTFHKIVKNISDKQTDQIFTLISIHVTKKLLWKESFLYGCNAGTRYKLKQGRIQGGRIGAIAPPKTYESNFIHHNFVQFGKQPSRYKAILPFTV